MSMKKSGDDEGSKWDETDSECKQLNMIRTWIKWLLVQRHMLWKVIILFTFFLGCRYRSRDIDLLLLVRLLSASVQTTYRVSFLCSFVN